MKPGLLCSVINALMLPPVCKGDSGASMARSEGNIGRLGVHGHTRNFYYVWDDFVFLVNVYNRSRSFSKKRMCFLKIFEIKNRSNF